MKYEIIHLPKEKWKGTTIPIKYTTDEYYNVLVNAKHNGYSIEIVKKDFSETKTYPSDNYDIDDQLYADYRENAYAWGVLVNDELVAAMETDQEIWSNRLRITILWVASFSNWL